MAIGWILSVLLSIMISITLEREYIDNSPNKVTPVEGTQGASTKSSAFTYAVSYSANKTQAVTLELLTQNSRVWAITGDCIVINREPIETYNQTLVNSAVRRFEAAFYKKDREGVPLFALANSSLLYTITAVSTNENGCVFLYLFNTKEALEDFLRSDNSDDLINIQGYYNRSDDCIKTDGTPHDVFFSINVTGETFVGIAANVSANITYTVRGTVVEYDTSNCTKNDIYNLTYNKPLKIDVCKSNFCAFQSNETIIVVDSEEQGVLIHWEPRPLELTLIVWIIIFSIVGLVILVGFAVFFCCLVVSFMYSIC